MFENLLSGLDGNAIGSLLFQVADPIKILNNVFDSEKGKQFINEKLMKDPVDLKNNIMLAFQNSKNSTTAEQKKNLELEQDKIIGYKNLSGELIRQYGMSEIQSCILAAGLFGIDPIAISDYLRSKGWNCSKQYVINYYSKNESWFKKFLNSKGKIIPGWNDSIEGVDLAPILDQQTDTKQKPQLVPMPDIDEPVVVPDQIN